MSSLASHKLVALVPMKAHSERIKNKNFKDFCGKPLFRWIVDTLLAIDAIDLIVINTDARTILESWGLKDEQRILVRDRKPEIRGDFVSMNLVLEDDINNVEAESYIMTHVTNPLLGKETIGKAISEFAAQRSAGKADSLFTVNRYQARFYDKNGKPVNHDPGNLIRTQDLDPMYEENSNLYIFTKDSFKKTNARIGEKPILFETPRFESVDIDEPEDWDIAKTIAENFILRTCG